MKVLNNWEESLHYVHKLGVANSSMPIGWKQQILMANVKLIEGLQGSTRPIYPLMVRYSRKDDSFTVRGITVKAIHR